MGNARRQQAVPDGLGLGGGKVELEPILAGVACAPHQGRHAQHGGLAAAESRQGGEIGLGQGIQNRDGGRPLQRQHIGLRRDVAELDVVPGGMGLQPAGILGIVGGVDHHHIALSQGIDKDIVDGAAILIAQQAVLGRTWLQRGEIAGDHLLQEGQRARALDHDLAHVGDVEQAGVLADGGVLLESAGGVLHWQQPAGELDHAGIEG